MLKKLFLSAVLCTASMVAMAQSQIITHVVQRGETLESIAKYYNISVADLNNANPNADLDICGNETGCAGGNNINHNNCGDNSDSGNRNNKCASRRNGRQSRIRIAKNRFLYSSLIFFHRKQNRNV